MHSEQLRLLHIRQSPGSFQEVQNQYHFQSYIQNCMHCLPVPQYDTPSSIHHNQSYPKP